MPRQIAYRLGDPIEGAVVPLRWVICSRCGVRIRSIESDIQAKETISCLFCFAELVHPSALESEVPEESDRPYHSPLADVVKNISDTFANYHRDVAKVAEAQARWDQDFLALARWFALRKSKDPSTKTGAVITNGRELVSVGYNGFPKGVNDDPERYANRELKYKLIVHCERNALLFAKRDLTGCTMYTWPFMSCSVCAGMVIQAGITRCVAPPVPDHLKARWEEDMRWSTTMFEEAGVELVITPLVEDVSS